MRAAIYYRNRDIRIEERPVPKIGDDEILVRIESSGICGSDMITHRLPLEETARGFHLVADGKKSIKVIIRPQE